MTRAEVALFVAWIALVSMAVGVAVRLVDLSWYWTPVLVLVAVPAAMLWRPIAQRLFR